MNLCKRHYNSSSIFSFILLRSSHRSGKKFIEKWPRDDTQRGSRFSLLYMSTVQKSAAHFLDLRTFGMNYSEFSLIICFSGLLWNRGILSELSLWILAMSLIDYTKTFCKWGVQIKLFIIIPDWVNPYLEPSSFIFSVSCITMAWDQKTRII